MANVQDRGPPSTASIALATAIVSGLAGYYFAQARSIGLFRSVTTRPAAGAAAKESDVSDAESAAHSDDEDDNVQDLGELKSFADSAEECKLVLVVRTDLGMGKGMWRERCAIARLGAHILSSRPAYLYQPSNFASPSSPDLSSLVTHSCSTTVLIPVTGKIAAQCGHATLACYKTLVRANPSHPVLRQWERLGQAKVALKVDSEEDMLMLQAQAISLGLCAQVIHDAGRTQIASGSATVLGIGPAPKSKVDEVTGHLRLL